MTVLLVVVAVVVCLAILVGAYLYNNMHYDDALMRRIRQAGFAERQVSLPDGSVIAYGEGPDNGPALLLIHGQSVAWKDYDTVLPRLSKSFHVFAADCYGHGKSSHTASLYSCRVNGEALVWFVKTVIGKPCYVSGHSSGGILAAWVASNAQALVNGVVLEDPPLFSVTPEEVRKGNGACCWFETYLPTHEFLGQRDETDFSLYYLKHSYIFALFGGLQDKIYRSAAKYRKTHPEGPVRIPWVPHALLRMLLYMDLYDPAFGNAFYDGSWMEGVDQARMLGGIRCPVVYLKANTRYGKDGVLYAADSDADSDRATALIENCERIAVRSGHDIHYERPGIFASACESLLQK